jgi:peptidoglycan hydrolase CwlO-like protein
MDASTIALWATCIASAAGVIYSITKNGRSRTKQDIETKIELKKDIESIKKDIAEVQKKLDDPGEGLGTIRREVSSMKENCARVSSGFNQRIIGIENFNRYKREKDR